MFTPNTENLIYFRNIIYIEEHEEGTTMGVMVHLGWPAAGVRRWAVWEEDGKWHIYESKINGEDVKEIGTVKDRFELKKYSIDGIFAPEFY